MCSTTSKLYLLERIGDKFVPIPMEYQNKYKINTENLTIEYGPGSIGLMDYYSEDPIYRDKYKVRAETDGVLLNQRDIETIDEAFDYLRLLS